MSGKSSKRSVRIDETKAILLGKECAIEQEIGIGDFSVAHHTSAERYQHELGNDLGHGTWMIYFENPNYGNEAQELVRRGVVETPGPSKHVIFEVNDQTGETELFLRL